MKYLLAVAPTHPMGPNDPLTASMAATWRGGEATYVLVPTPKDGGGFRGQFDVPEDLSKIPWR